MSPVPRPTELTHQRLIRAALELFSSRGYHDTTTAQIAKKAGVAEGTIYRHFPSKQQLLNELYRAALRWAAKTEDDAAAATPRAPLALGAQRLVDGPTPHLHVVKVRPTEQPPALLAYQ